MKSKKGHFEDFIGKAFDGQLVEPDSKVLRNIRFKLWKDEFLSLNFRKFNFVYASIILAGLFSVPFVANTSDNDPNEEIASTTTEHFEAIMIDEEPTQPSNSSISPELNNSEEIEKTAVRKLVAEAKFTTNIISGCAPLSVKFKNQSSNAQMHKWSFGDGNTSVDVAPEHIYTEPGTYTASLEIEGAAGDKRSIAQEIKVFALPEASFEIDVDASSISKRLVSFKNTSKNASNCTWYFGDNQDLTAVSDVVTHKYSDYKPYTVRLVVENEMGCSHSTTQVNTFIENNYTLVFPMNFRLNNNTTSNNGYYENAQYANSVFYPKNYGAKKYSLQISAPNGLVVFTTSNIKQGWNGKIRGRMAPSGTYTYLAEGIYPNDVPFNIKGKFTLKVDNFQENY